jgi:GT2 family glycosyltransferase
MPQILVFRTQINTVLQLSVIIVNYNVKYFLEQCLCSVRKACAQVDAEVFVVDNHSSDGSREWLEPKFPEVKFRWNSSNEGFGKASNSVLKEATGDYILFLNPDTIVAEDCFSKCVDFFKTHKNCGALGVRMIDGSGKFLRESKRSFPSTSASFYKMTGLANLFSSSKMFARYYAGHLPEKKNNEVDVLAGAFMMLSKKVIEITRGFDEDFFMYGEDVDLSYRIQQAGMQNWYFADTTIIHFKGESTQRFSPSYIKHFYGAMGLFVKKHYSNQKAKLFFLNTAIKIARSMASAGVKAERKSGKELLQQKAENTAIVAGQKKFNECLHLIKYASFPVVVCGRIAIDPGDKDTAIGKIANLKETLRKNQIRQIVFCGGEQSFKTIISQVESVPLSVTVLLTAENSASIIGSNNRNTRGIFIAKPGFS